MATPAVGMTPEQMQAEIDRLRALNARLSAPKALTLKVSEKGALSVYGMGKWPVTLYREQWERLIAHTTTIQDFISAHAGQLKMRGEGEA